MAVPISPRAKAVQAPRSISSLADTSVVPNRTSLSLAFGRRILERMLGWVVLAILGSLAAVAALVDSGVLRVHRYSPVHVDGRLAVAGRGLFLSRTADGLWWRLRLRPCRRVLEDRDGWDGSPPEGGVREPRRPLGPPPRADQIALHEPGH